MLDRLLGAAIEIQPSGDLRDEALRLLDLHSLRAGDALQLAAAINCAGSPPRNFPFVCTDRRLRVAAMRHGFEVLPVEDEVHEP